MNIEELLGGNMEGLMAQAKQMQTQMAEAQAKAKELRVVGEAGGGMVKVEATGDMRVTSVTVDKAVVGDDVEMLQDLIAAATNDALRKSREAVEASLGPMAQMMKQAGMGL